MAKLQTAFPKMKQEFFNLLTERLVINGFSDRRLKDAVGSVLDRFTYKEINISDVIGYDKRVKLYTYSQVCDQVSAGDKFDDFKIKEIEGNKYWIKNTDL